MRYRSDGLEVEESEPTVEHVAASEGSGLVVWDIPPPALDLRIAAPQSTVIGGNLHEPRQVTLEIAPNGGAGTRRPLVEATDAPVAALTIPVGAYRTHWERAETALPFAAPALAALMVIIFFSTRQRAHRYSHIVSAGAVLLIAPTVGWLADTGVAGGVPAIILPAVVATALRIALRAPTLWLAAVLLGSGIAVGFVAAVLDGPKESPASLVGTISGITALALMSALTALGVLATEAVPSLRGAAPRDQQP